MDFLDHHPAVVWLLTAALFGSGFLFARRSREPTLLLAAGVLAVTIAALVLH